MPPRASDALRGLVTEKLVAEGLVYEGAKAFVTPRRLALTVHGIPVRQPDLKDERKGPRVGAPDAAIQGFLKGAGLSSLSEARIEKDPKKGEFYVALIEKPGRPSLEVIAEFLPVIIRTFPWPKSMRWGSGSLRWVRPIKRILCLFDGKVVPFEIDGIQSDAITEGHRFLGSGQLLKASDFVDYRTQLEREFVLLDVADRKLRILEEAKAACAARGPRCA